MESSYQGGVINEETGKNYHSLSQTITSNIKKISQNVSSMTKMVNQLQTPQDSHELRNQLRQIQHYTQKLAKDTSNLIMELMKVPTDQPAQKLTRERLRDEYMITLNSFQATQRLAAQKSKEEVKRQRAQSISAGDPFAINRPASNNELLDLSEQNIQKQEQLTMQTEQSLIELEERERDIRSLENDILDVNHIFKELGTMIHAQGQIVDSIEASVENTTAIVEVGTQQLGQAASYKNKLRKRKVYLIIVLIIVISIIMILIFKH